MPIFRYDVNLTWNGLGAPGVNVWHIRTTGIDPAASDLADAVTALTSFYEDICEIGCCPAGWTAAGASQAINVEDSSIVPLTSWTRTSAQSATDFSAPSMVVVGLRTNTATRAGRGRKFIGPLSVEAMGSDGTVENAMLSSIRTAAATLAAASGGVNDWAIGVYSASTNVLRDVTAMPVRDTIATLRSRRD